MNVGFDFEENTQFLGYWPPAFSFFVSFSFLHLKNCVILKFLRNFTKESWYKFAIRIILLKQRALNGSGMIQQGSSNCNFDTKKRYSYLRPMQDLKLTKFRARFIAVLPPMLWPITAAFLISRSFINAMTSPVMWSYDMSSENGLAPWFRASTFTICEKTKVYRNVT